MKVVLRNSKADAIFGMSNICGDKIKVPHRVNFSMFVSIKPNIGHNCIRIKFSNKPNKMSPSNLSELILKSRNAWQFKLNKNEPLSAVQQKEIISFVKTYLVLICMIWDAQIEATDVLSYFKGDISLSTMISRTIFYEDNKRLLDKISSINQLEDICRTYNLVDFHKN